MTAHGNSSRRRFLGLLSTATGAALGLRELPLLARGGGGAAGSGGGAGEFTFVVINDLHYRDERCGVYLRRVVEHIRALRPRPAFVVLAGDLSENGRREELRAVREIFERLPMPVKKVVGNHDYELTGGRAPYEAEFGAVVNYRFQHGGCEFLALDTTEGRSVYRTRISEATLGWVDRTLPGLSPRAPVIILTHFPLGWNWLRPRNANELLAKFRERPLVAALAGHWHGLTERREQAAALSTGRCCSWWRTNHDGSAEKGYTLARVQEGRVSHAFVGVAGEKAESENNVRPGGVLGRRGGRLRFAKRGAFSRKSLAVAGEEN